MENKGKICTEYAWIWCADWCRRKGLSPWVNENWHRAQRAFSAAHGILYPSTSSQ